MRKLFYNGTGGPCGARVILLLANILQQQNAEAAKQGKLKQPPAVFALRVLAPKNHNHEKTAQKGRFFRGGPSVSQLQLNCDLVGLTLQLHVHQALLSYRLQVVRR